MLKKFDTEIVSDEEKWIKLAAGFIRTGELVAIPTETVYGLGANALDKTAVAKIFEAKGRPQDNPLIVHVADFDGVEPLVSEITEIGRRLMNAFWPGPLTLIFNKSDLVPEVTSGGLNTVGVRMPASVAARKLIRAAGVPIAAPSANLSGSPSPTTARHVFDDLAGKIPLIIDGGTSEVGVESTVVDVTGEVPVVLRPGAITPEMIVEVVGEVLVDDAVLARLDGGRAAPSPGMRYRHYSPKAPVVLVDAESGSDFADFVNRKAAEADAAFDWEQPNSQSKLCSNRKISPQAGLQEKAVKIIAICFSGEEERLSVPYLVLGERDNLASQAHNVFEILRKADQAEADIIYCHAPSFEGVGLAVFNRLLRAAEFNVIKI